MVSGLNTSHLSGSKRIHSPFRLDCFILPKPGAHPIGPGRLAAQRMPSSLLPSPPGSGLGTSPLFSISHSLSHLLIHASLTFIQGSNGAWLTKKTTKNSG